MTRRYRDRLAGGVFGAVLSVVGLAACAAPGDRPVDPASAIAKAPATPSPTVRKPRGPVPLPAAAKVTVTSVSVSSIDVRATDLEQLALDSDGALAAPEDPDRAGWYAGGTVPGEIGPAVIAGHVDSKTGPAVFFELREVSRGDKVVVTLSNKKKTTFVVDRVITTPKKGFPTDEVFGPTPAAELRVITCGGPYNRTVGSYVDNTVVFATAQR